MKAIITGEQLNGIMSQAMCEAAGYTIDILTKIDMVDKLRLIDCVIGEIIDNGNNTFTIGLSLSNPHKVLERVAHNNPTAEQVDLWRSFGIEIIEE